MNEHDDCRLRIKLRDALRRDSYVLRLKEIPPLYEFTDGMHRESLRCCEVFRTLRNTESWIDSVYGSSIPSVSEARDQSQKAMENFQAKCRDGMTYADNDLRVAWKKHLSPAMTKLIGSLVDYTITLLEASRKEGRFGTRTRLGRTVRVSIRPCPTNRPDYLGLQDEFEFEEEKEFDEQMPETSSLRVIDYVPIKVSPVTNVGPAAQYQDDIARMVARFPMHVQELLKLEHGLMVEGEQKGVTVLLFHETAISFYEQPMVIKSSNPVRSTPPKKKRKSILSSFRIGVLLLTLLVLASTVHYPKQDPSTFQEPSSEIGADAVAENHSLQENAMPHESHQAPEKITKPETFGPADPFTLSSHSGFNSSAKLVHIPAIDDSSSSTNILETPGSVKVQSNEPANFHAINLKIKPVSGTRIYNSIMALIEPELCTDNLAATREKYKSESLAEAKQRKARYIEAFRLYDLCYEEYIRTIRKQAAEMAQISKLVTEKRRQRMQQNSSS